MNNIPIDDEQSKVVNDMIIKTISFFQKEVPFSDKYTPMNVYLNILTATMITLAGPYFANMKAEEDFIAHLNIMMKVNFARIREENGVVYPEEKDVSNNN